MSSYPVDVYSNQTVIEVFDPNPQVTFNTCDVWENSTAPINATNSTNTKPHALVILSYVTSVCYIIIFILGLAGNGLVIYVVLMCAKMKTVTNMYILNLALSDILFIIILPLMATTAFMEHWIFGFAMCKIYFVLYSINFFGSAFNLCVMSADRYLAVCHPIRSLKYRTPRIALFLCLCVWSVSFLVMLPIILYSRTRPNPHNGYRDTCSILWPEDQPIPPDKAFIWYSFILGFAIPVALISVFYILVIIRLRYVGPTKKSKEKRKSHRRVTRLVLTVITIYVVCWLPYWCFQVHIVFNDIKYLTDTMILLFSGFTILCFANSMLNPFLYAFLSDNFRKSFIKAFKCLSYIEINKSVCQENSVFPRSSQTYTRSAVTADERMELSTMEMTNLPRNSPPNYEDSNSRSPQDEQGFLKPPVQL